jgi:hypothetical protein
MINYLKENFEFIIMLLIWVVVGVFSYEIDFILVPAGLALLKYKGRYMELIISFFFLLFLCDNRHYQVVFASQTKDIALLMLSGFVFLDAKSFPVRSKLFYPFIAFFVLAFSLTVISPQPMLSFQKCLSFALMMAIIPNYFLQQLEEDGEKFLKNIIWLSTLMWIIGLAMIFILNDWVFLEGRYNGLLGNPNGVGLLAALFFMLVVIAKHHYPKIFTRNEQILIFGVMILSVLLASSRNAIFSIGIFLFFSRFYKISYWAGFLILIVVAVLYQVINENLATIITGLGLGSYFRVEHLNDGSGRLIAWTYGWKEIQHNFLFGRGFAYEEMYFEANKWWLNDLGHQGGVHNTYLALWMNTGIVGLILYMIGFFKTFFKAARTNFYALPAMFTIMFSITFEAWFQASLNPFTISALLVITLLQYVKPISTEEKSTLPVL